MLQAAAAIPTAYVNDNDNSRSAFEPDLRNWPARQAEFNALKAELVSSGAAASGAAGGDALQRMDTIEAELSRLAEDRQNTVIVKINLRLALAGDPSDNIQGIAGVGPVGAAKLLQERGFAAIALEPTTEEFDAVRLRAGLSHKIAATRSGLGWIGKSDLFISTELGS